MDLVARVVAWREVAAAVGQMEEREEEEGRSVPDSLQDDGMGMGVVPMLERPETHLPQGDHIVWPGSTMRCPHHMKCRCT